MKLDLDSLSKRFNGAGLLALVVQGLIPGTPAWLGQYSAIAIIAGLGFMLAHEITTRKQRERTAKLTVETT